MACASGSMYRPTMCPLNVLLRTVPTPDDGAQSLAVLGSNDDANRVLTKSTDSDPMG
jgi:hypothetical protein